MMDHLTQLKLKRLSFLKLKDLMRPLYNKHMDDIISGHFSSTMMADWANDDVNLLGWREETGEAAFENCNF